MSWEDALNKLLSEQALIKKWDNEAKEMPDYYHNFSTTFSQVSKLGYIDENLVTDFISAYIGRAKGSIEYAVMDPRRVHAALFIQYPNSGIYKVDHGDQINTLLHRVLSIAFDINIDTYEDLKNFMMRWYKYLVIANHIKDPHLVGTIIVAILSRYLMNITLIINPWKLS